MHKSNTVYKWKQSKAALNKYVSGFWCERQQGMNFELEEALLWIMDSYFGQNWKLKV